MGDFNISEATNSDYTNTMTNYSVDAVTTDGASEQKETEYMINDFSQWFGYYKKIPELKAAIDGKARWAIGKGYTADPMTTIILDRVVGFGKDTFNTILENMIRTYYIAGDSFAEIITNKKGYIVNLKPLDPSTMKIIANRKGVVIRYEQTAKTSGKTTRKFKPEQIFHLSRNRTADEIHGESLVPAVEEIILMRNEAMQDYKKLLHRNVCPIRIWKLDTQNPTKITAFKAKVEAMKENFEDIFIPKGTVETEISAVPPNATLNPLPWINQLTQYFFQAVGMPQIVVGGSQEMTEATAKIAYLAFEQNIEEEQLYIEEQVLNQLYLEINLEFPASLQNDLITSKAKEETMQASTPEDTNVQGMALNSPQEMQGGM